MLRRPSAGGRRWLPAGATLLLLLTIGAGGGAVPASAQTGSPDAPPAATTTTPTTPTGPPVTATAAVTLLTGDRVWFDRSPHGGYEVTVDPAPREGFDGSFQTVDDGEQLYVIPSDAAALVPEVLDRELFNVARLAGHGYTGGVAVIITYRTVPPPGVTAPGLTDIVELTSIGATAAVIDPDGVWWRGVRAGGPTGPLAEVRRVWLDDRIEVSLAESVPLVGAPQAWDAGYDGTGTTVAVLDTGIDADHPDLAGTVVAEGNFTDSDTAADRHGHGTHVAGIVAGSGEASGGTYRGVAPGADLLNGKVLGDDGSGRESEIIAGMEWAAEQGADVVNLSLGGPASDGTDPMSQAVNELTAQHGVLFAIAAGNAGSGDHTVASPGAADAALTVGAVDKSEQLASFSSRGPRLGDFAVKPDVTAPGVGIGSARAAGTDLGTPGEEGYTRASGTSMAAPHAAGAAAILLQAEPDLTPAQAKARLVTSAVPHPDLDVYQQGGGRIDIPAALGAPVQASPSGLDLGHFPYPQDGEPAVSTELSYTNPGGEPVTLDLSLDVRSRGGVAPVPGMLSITPAELTIEPGGTAQASVTLDPAVGEIGLYGGSVVATTADGGTAARTPVGFHKEPERYDLTVVGTARDGRPAGGTSSVSILDVEDMTRFMQPGHVFVDGTVQVRVPPGTYSVLAGIHTYDAHDEDIQQTAFVGEPEVAVTGDTTVVLEARDANPISVSAPDHETRPQGAVGMGYWRTAAQPGPMLGLTFLGLHAGREFFAAPTDPVSLGGFEFYSRWRLAAPEAELAVTEPAPRQLDPVLMRAPAVDGVRQLRLVDVGDGAGADYSGVDVAGAAVLARRGPVPFTEQEQRAAQAGAAALIITNDVPGPLLGSLAAGAGTIPTLSLTRAEGDELRDLVAAGSVTVRLSGTRWSPYLYDLVMLEVGRVSGELDYTVDSSDLAVAEISYHNDAAGHPMAEARHFSRPYHSSSIYLHPHIEGPRERTEYLIGGDAMSYRQTVYGELPFQAQLREPDYRSYAPGEEVERSWFQQVVRPALVPEVGMTTRTGDTLDLEVYEWVDDSGNLFPEVFGLAPYPGDSIEARLYRDGELVAEAEEPRGRFPMAAEPADYRLELDVSREAEWWQRSTDTSTSWTFGSAPPAGDAVAVLPLLSIDYQVDLDLANTTPPPPRQTVLGLRVSQQDSGQPPVAGARLWVSYDDGASWLPQPLQPRGGGRFNAVLPNPAPEPNTGAVSLRVEAWDADGNRIEQEVTRAWLLP